MKKGWNFMVKSIGNKICGERERKENISIIFFKPTFCWFYFLPSLFNNIFLPFLLLEGHPSFDPLSLHFHLTLQYILIIIKLNGMCEDQAKIFVWIWVSKIPFFTLSLSPPFSPSFKLASQTHTFFASWIHSIPSICSSFLSFHTFYARKYMNLNDTHFFCSPHIFKDNLFWFPFHVHSLAG